MKKLPSEYMKEGNVFVTCELDEKILDVVADGSLERTP